MNPHPPQESWIGRVVVNVSEPRTAQNPHRLFKVVKLETRANQIRFLLKNRHKEKWGEWGFNHWGPN